MGLGRRRNFAPPAIARRPMMPGCMADTSIIDWIVTEKNIVVAVFVKHAADAHRRLRTKSNERRKKSMKSILACNVVAACFAAIAGIAGCASTPVPNAKIASSEGAIRAAEETGSKNIPQAALHLKLAEEQLQTAKTLIRENDNKRAEYVLMRAQADAELAIALSHAAAANAKAGAAVDAARAVHTGTTTP